MELPTIEEMKQEINNLKSQLAGIPEMKDQVAQLIQLIKGKGVLEWSTKKPEFKINPPFGEGSGHKGPFVDCFDEEIPDFEEKSGPNGEVVNVVVPEKINLLQEILKALEGFNVYGLTDASQLCLFHDVVIPPKFNTPEFEK